VKKKNLVFFWFFLVFLPNSPAPQNTVAAGELSVDEQNGRATVAVPLPASGTTVFALNSAQPCLPSRFLLYCI
jgi:hypothetical protein